MEFATFIYYFGAVCFAVAITTLLFCGRGYDRAETLKNFLGGL